MSVSNLGMDEINIMKMENRESINYKHPLQWMDLKQSIEITLSQVTYSQIIHTNLLTYI